MKKYYLVFFIIAAISVCSCKKTLLTGSGLLPKGDNVNGINTDTTTLLTKTIRENNLYTNTSGTYLLGTMFDPVFGKSYAGIFTQLAPGEGGPSFHGCVLDSVVLCLVYAGKYGDLKTVPQSVSVYELTGAMNVDSSYLSGHRFAYNPAKIGSKQNFIPDFLTTPRENGDTFTLPPQLRIRLSNSFGQALLSDSLNYASTEAFQAFMPGLFITPDTTMANPGKGIMYFNLINGSKLSLYYHNTQTNTSNGQYDILLGNGCAKTNFFKHDYSNSIAGKALNSSATSDSTVYVQAMAGLRTQITLPYLPPNILINKAEISITQVLDPATEDTAFHVPNQMFVLADSAQNDQLTADLLVDAPLSYGGLKTSFVNSRGQTLVTYTFSCTDVLQQMVANLKNYNRQKSYPALYMITATSTDVADRIIAGGGNSKAAKMKLNLVYNKLP